MPEKPTKAGMESANQIQIQPLASCIGERKVSPSGTKPTRLATGVVCHSDTEQNWLYKIPWSCRKLNRGPTAPQAKTLPVCHTTEEMISLALKQNGNISSLLLHLHSIQSFYLIALLLLHIDYTLLSIIE